ETRLEKLTGDVWMEFVVGYDRSVRPGGCVSIRPKQNRPQNRTVGEIRRYIDVAGDAEAKRNERVLDGSDDARARNAGAPVVDIVNVLERPEERADAGPGVLKVVLKVPRR